MPINKTLIYLFSKPPREFIATQNMLALGALNQSLLKIIGGYIRALHEPHDMSKHVLG